jgi:hypothetical protein
MLQHVVVNVNITISSRNYSTKKDSVCTALSVSDPEETASTPTSCRSISSPFPSSALSRASVSKRTARI